MVGSKLVQLRALFIAMVVIGAGLLYARFRSAPFQSTHSLTNVATPRAAQPPSPYAPVRHEQRKRMQTGEPVSSKRIEWSSQFHKSHDYYQFISNAERAAQAGDGRAAFYIGQALLSCVPIVKQYRSSSDPEADFQAEIAKLPNAPQWTINLHRDEFQRCLHLAKEDPLNHFDLPIEAHSYKYWFSAAVTDGDPVAIADRAVQTLANLEYQSPQEADTNKQTVQTDLKTIVLSNDPEAIYRVGFLLINGRYSSDPLLGVAMTLAACDLGYDCSAKNPDNVFSRCSLTGACPADADYAYYIQQSLGPDKYALAFAKAQEFKDALSNGDQGMLDKFIELRTP